MKMCCESQTVEISLTVGFDFVLIRLIVHRNKCKTIAEHRGFSQFLRLRRKCSNDVDFSEKAEEMLTFFKQRGYPEPQLHNDLQRVTTNSREETLSPTRLNITNVNIVSLVLTYHPFNTVTRKILLENFNILLTDSNDDKNNKNNNDFNTESTKWLFACTLKTI